MNHEIGAMLTASEGRYPTRAEQALLRGWAAQLEARLAAMEAIRAAEEAIVGQVCDEVMAAYPNVEKFYKDMRASCVRDLSLVVRYCAQALLRDDLQYLEDSLLTWMASILRGVGLAPAFIEDTYKALMKAAARELPPTVNELLRPYLERCVAVLPGKREAAT